MKKVLFSYALIICALCVNAQVISQHGIVLNGGTGSLKSKIDKSIGSWEEIDYKFGLSVGYRLRFSKPDVHSFHYDLDLNVGTKLLDNNSYFYNEATGDYLSGYSGSASPDYFTAIGGTINYSLIKNLSMGLGLEPTYYFRQVGRSSKNKLDIPVVAKIAYNLKKVEIGLSYKYGLMGIEKSYGGRPSGGYSSGEYNVYDMIYNKSSIKFRDIQLSLFIPF